MKFLGIIALAFVSSAVWARPTVPAALPPVAYADTETMTNVPFTASLDVSGRFSFTLSCLTTPTNNVEVAFGMDANSNGVLEPEEIGRVVGWDCGSWFTRKGADGAYRIENVEWRMQNDSTNEIRTLSWQLQVGVGGRPLRLTATSGGAAVFAGLPLESVYSPSWNLLRLTGRGLDVSLETFSVSVTPDGTAFIMR